MTSVIASEVEPRAGNIITKTDLEERIDLIIEGSLPYFNSLFKKMLFAKLENAELLSDFIISEYNIQNIKFSTKMGLYQSPSEICFAYGSY